MSFKTMSGLVTGTALLFGGVDASALNEVPIQRIETVANERVEAKQIGNVIETTLPWKGEKGLKVKVDLGEPTLVEKLKDKRKKEIITETVTDFDGGFKVDILLNEKPNTNKFCYQIEGTENYDFFYQPPLTEQERIGGSSRPPEIEGSYAVYHKTLANHRIGGENYATGKVMHIPRPQVWELGNEEATKQWADLLYEDGQLCVTAPQDFLDKADYTNGVRIDPTFGYTTVGASNETNNTTLVGGVFTAPANIGIISEIQIRCSSISAATTRKGVMVASSTATILPNGVGAGSATNCSGAASWVISTYATSPTLVAGTDYIIMNISNGGNTSTAYDASTGTGWRDTSNVYATPTDPTDGVRNTNKYSIYATYEPFPYGIRINNGTIRINNGTLDI